MAGIDVKMGVSGIAQFKSAMNEGNQAVKTIDAQLKLTEKQFQATGDKQTYMANKSKLLKQQIAEQNKIIKEGQNALKAMEQQGVSPASAAYQKMQRDVVNAQASLLDMNGALDTVGQSTEETAQKTDKLTSSLNGINKKVSFDAVLGGIGKITDGMEAAGRKVEALTRDVWQNIVDAATWADDVTTLSQVYGIDVERLQAMMKVAANEIQTPVDAIIKAQQKLKNNLAYGTKDVQDAFQKLGVSMKEWGPNGFLGNPEWVSRNWEDVFWDLGEALKNYGDEVERDAMAQKIFGRGWQELRLLFAAGRNKYEEEIAEQTVVNAESMEKLNELSATIKNVQQDFETLKNSAFAQLAPAFNEVGKSVSDLLGKFNEYLNTPEGQEKLGELSQAVTDLFSGLSDVDFGSALDTAKDILDKIVGALTWIKDNHELVEGAIKGIGGAFVAMKAAEVVGTLVQSASALKNLLVGGNSSGSAFGPGNSSLPQTTQTSEMVRKLRGTDKIFKETEQIPETQTGGSGFWSKAWEFLKGIPEVATIASPIILAVDQVVQDLNHQKAASAEIARRTEYYEGRYAEIDSTEGDQKYEDLKRTYKDFSSATIDTIEAGKLLQTLTNAYDNWSYDYDKIVDPIFDNISEETAKDFEQLLNDYLDGVNVDPVRALEIVEQITAELDKALNEKKPKVEPEPVLPADVASILQEQLAGVALHVTVIPDLASVSLDGEHANGLPFVPFDGYIAALHRGERVVPASQNKNYTNTSNIYFDKVNVNNGIDADGLAAKIAATTRQTLAGFGG